MKPFRILFAFALPALAFLLAPGTVRADITLSFDPSDTTIASGSSAVIQVVVDAGATDLQGFSLSFDYDDSIVDLVTLDKGALLSGAGCPSFLDQLNPGVLGTVEVDGASLGCSMTGPGSIVEVSFLAGGFAFEVMTPLTFDCSGARLRDSMNNPIDVTCVDGSITILPPISVEPGSWGRMKSRYR